MWYFAVFREFCKWMWRKSCMSLYRLMRLDLTWQQWEEGEETLLATGLLSMYQGNMGVTQCCHYTEWGPPHWIPCQLGSLQHWINSYIFRQITQYYHSSKPKGPDAIHCCLGQSSFPSFCSGPKRVSSTPTIYSSIPSTILPLPKSHRGVLLSMAVEGLWSPALCPDGPHSSYGGSMWSNWSSVHTRVWCWWGPVSRSS